MQAGNDCVQAIPSSVYLLLNDENDDRILPAEVCNASDSSYIQVDDSNITLSLLITLECLSFDFNCSKHSGDLVLKQLEEQVLYQKFHLVRTLSYCFVPLGCSFWVTLHFVQHHRYQRVEQCFNNTWIWYSRDVVCHLLLCRWCKQQVLFRITGRKQYLFFIF